MSNIQTLIRNICTKDISLFLYANILYSLSTGLISVLSPFILSEKNTFENFIYIFQNVMYLTSVFTVGFTIALLRYYKYNPQKYEYFYCLIVSLILGLIVLLGLLKNNYLTQWLNLTTQSHIEHFLTYLCVCFSLMYIFNRAYLTAQRKYKNIINGILIIFIFRIIAICTVSFFHINNLSLILLIICILPMSNELLVFSKKLLSIKKDSKEGMGEFVFFAFKTAIIGIVFLTSNKLLIISVKAYDNSMAASLSFANGLIGMISILNATISSFYIGKLDYKNTTSITFYINKVKRFCPFFFLGLAIVSITTFYFVKITYPTDSVRTAWISFITIFQSGIIFYLGLITLLSKIYNCLNFQLVTNISVCFIIYIIIKLSNQQIDIISEYLLVNFVIIIGEIILLIFVVHRHKYYLKRTF